MPTSTVQLFSDHCSQPFDYQDMGESKKCKIKQNSVIGNFTLPGFRYLGPGGVNTNEPPTNAADGIAQKHDQAYEQAIENFKISHNLQSSVEEIQKADEKFLMEMKELKATSLLEAVGKTVGLASIGIKAAVEKLLGHTLYPTFDKIDEDCKVRAGDDFN